MLSQVNIEALIGRLQDHALADAPGTMSKAEVDAAIALLDRVLPDLHYIELNTPSLQPILVTMVEGAVSCARHDGHARGVRSRRQAE